MITNFIYNSLYEVDIFKVPFTLLFKNRKQSSTIIGSIYSLFLLGVVLYLFVKSNLVQKTNPLVINQQMTSESSPYINLNQENFQIAVGLADSLGNGFLDPTIFKILFLQIEIDYNNETDSRQIKSTESKGTKKCSPEMFNDSYTFKRFGLANYTCPKNGSFALEGSFAEKNLKYLAVMIKYCDNETDGVICKSPEKIANFFVGKGLWIYYQDDIYDIADYASPISKNWRLQTIQITGEPKVVDLYMKELVFINDDNLLFDEEKITRGFMKERLEGLSHFSPLNNELITMNVFSSKNNQKIFRQYQKFGALLANIGGVINILTILGYFLTSTKNKLQIQSHIMNNLYDYSVEKEKKKEKKKRMINTENEHVENFEKNAKQIKTELNSPLSFFSSKTKKNQNKPLEINFESPEIPNEKKENEEFNFFSHFYENKRFSINLESPKAAKKEVSEEIIFKKKEKPKLELFSLKQNLKKVPSKNSPKAAFKPNTHKNLAETKFLSFSLYEYFVMNVKLLFKKPLSNKEKIFRLTESRFEKETDITNILKKLHAFDKLKMIILDEYQLDAFECLGKPIIYLDSQIKKIEFSAKKSISKLTKIIGNPFERTLEQERIEKLQKFYTKYASLTDISQINKNLLGLIAEEDCFKKNETK